MAFTTMVNPTFSDYRTALRNALTGVGFTETALSGSNEFGYTLAATGHNFAIKMDPNIIQALPFSGAVAGGSAWTAQSGTVTSPTTAGNQVRQNPLAANMTNYWIFSRVVSAGTVVYVHAVCEVTPGVFSHFMAGVLDKSGSYAGGAYCQATFISDTATLRNRTENAIPFQCGQVSTQRSTYVSMIGSTLTSSDAGAKSNVENYLKSANGDMHVGWAPISFGNAEDSITIDLFTMGVNTQNGLTPLIPIYSKIPIGTSHFNFLGSVHDARWVNIQYFVGGNTLTLGSDTWYLFPLWVKGAGMPLQPGLSLGEDITDTGWFGLAYKEIP